jgi:hypothetical protein
LVTARFHTSQGGLVFGRQWISPMLFPLYTQVLWFNLGISCAIFAIVLSMLAFTGNSLTVTETLNALMIQLLIQFGVVTAIFSAVERSVAALDWQHAAKGVHPAWWAIGSQPSQQTG